MRQIRDTAEGLHLARGHHALRALLAQ